MAHLNGMYARGTILAAAIVLHGGIAWISLPSLAGIFFLDGFLLFLLGYILLPRKPGWSGWKRTLGIWSLSVTCLLFAGGALYAGDEIVSVIIGVAVICLLVGVLLLMGRPFSPPHAQRGA